MTIPIWVESLLLKETHKNCDVHRNRTHNSYWHALININLTLYVPNSKIIRFVVSKLVLNEADTHFVTTTLYIFYTICPYLLVWIFRFRRFSAEWISSYPCENNFVYFNYSLSLSTRATSTFLDLEGFTLNNEYPPIKYKTVLPESKIQWWYRHVQRTILFSIKWTDMLLT